MAQFQNNFVQDLQQDIKIRQCGTIVFNADNLSNVVSVELYNGEEAYSGGGTVVGAVVCPDGATVALDGTLSGNKASITLTGDCFALPGQIGVSIQIVIGDVRTTVLKAIYNVDVSSTDTIVDPDSRISLSLAEIEAKLDEVPTILASAQTAIDGIEAQKDTMIASIASVAGQGTDTTLTQSGVAADAKATGDQVRDLKSTISAVAQKFPNDLVATSIWEQGRWANIANNPYKVDAADRIRTEIAFSAESKLRVENTANCEYLYAVYDGNGNVVSSASDWASNSRNVNLSGTYRLLFCIRYANGNNISPSDILKTGITLIVDDALYGMPKELSDAYKARKKARFLYNSGLGYTYRYKYTKNLDCAYRFKFKGANNNFGMSNIAHLANTGDMVKSVFNDFTEANNFYSLQSEWLSPYNNLKAVNDADGDFTSGFTGGSHTLGSGVATMSNESIKVFIDEKETSVTPDTVYDCDEITFVISNLIQACNTVKTDGTGRAVVRETQRINVKPDCVDVYLDIEFLEDCTLDTYYFAEHETYAWKDLMWLVSDANHLSPWETTLSDYDGSDKTACIINGWKMTKDGEFTSCVIDSGYGIGNRSLIKNDTPTAIARAYGKFYSWLIDGKTFSGGDIVSLHCTYRFWHQ